MFEDGFQSGSSLVVFVTVPKIPIPGPAAGAAGKGAKRLARPLRDGTAAGSSHLI
jgi:hypothetical protein